MALKNLVENTEKLQHDHGVAGEWRSLRLCQHVGALSARSRLGGLGLVRCLQRRIQHLGRSAKAAGAGQGRQGLPRDSTGLRGSRDRARQGNSQFDSVVLLASSLQVLNLLAQKFPIHTNAKGFRVLPPYLRVMQGDGVSLETVGPVLEAVRTAGWSTENTVFGAGGALLQKVDRDTLKCAFKCSYVTVDGEGVRCMTPVCLAMLDIYSGMSGRIRARTAASSRRRDAWCC